MSSLPKTYKAVVVSSAGGPYELKDVELQQPGENEILVKVLACGVCFSDVAIANGEFGPQAFPHRPGHEYIGDVAAVGSGVKGFELGERVGGTWHGGHDNSCRSCRRGLFQMCDNEEVNGFTRAGGWAEYVLLRAEAAAHIPSDVDPADAAPLLCAGVTVFNGIRKMNVAHGGLVAVQGLGGLGHLAVQYASKMGYEVVVLSSGDAKEAFARELGAHHYINTAKTDDVAAALMKMGGADLVIQTAPNPAVIKALVGGLAAAGKLVSLAPVGNVEVDTVHLLVGGRSINGWPAGHAFDCEEAVQFAKVHGIKCMVDKFPLSDVQAAVDSIVAGKPRFRNVLVMQ